MISNRNDEMQLTELLYIAFSLSLVVAGLSMVAFAVRAYHRTSRPALFHLSVGFTRLVAASLATTISAFLFNFGEIRYLLVQADADFLFVVGSVEDEDAFTAFVRTDREKLFRVDDGSRLAAEVHHAFDGVGRARNPRDPFYYHDAVNLVDIDGTHVVTESELDDLGLLARVVFYRFMFLNAHSQLVNISKSRI